MHVSLTMTMPAGCRYVGSELRRGPDGSMLYQWLASMPVSRGRELYTRLLEHFPLLFNTQVRLQRLHCVSLCC
jgi:hypothetical protein